MDNIDGFFDKLKNYYYRRDRIIAFYVLLVVGILFVFLTAFVILVPTPILDVQLSRELQENRNTVFDAYMRFVSWWGINEVAISSISIVVVLCLIKSMVREAIFVALTGLTSIVNFGLKLLVNRSRPTDDLVQIIEEAHNNSFPSGHTAHYVVFFGFLLVVLFRLRSINKWIRAFLGVFFLLLIVSIPFSRMYLGAHWFTDVLAGFFLGFISLAVLLYFYFKKPYDLSK